MDLGDGLPPSAHSREGRGAIAASGRAAAELDGIVPPRFARATVEKIAVNAVMAAVGPSTCLW